jgi:hypothetical protein
MITLDGRFHIRKGGLMIRKPILIVSLLVASAILLSCVCPIGTAINEGKATAIVMLSGQPPAATLPVKTTAPKVTQPPTPTAIEPLSTASADIPLVAHVAIVADNGLWIAKGDGTSLTHVSDQYILNNTPLQDCVSPGGDKLAFITADSAGSYAHLTLNLYDLATGQVRVLTRLTTDATEPPAGGSLPDFPGFEGLRAIADRASIAWSPVDEKLAFTAMLDEPQADLYIYDFATGTISRSTKDPAQTAAPVWSPDGKIIITVEVETFGFGAGATVNGLMMSYADTPGNYVLLYDTPDSGWEEVLGFRDNTTFVVYTWTRSYGPGKLRTLDTNTMNEQTLRDAPFVSAALDAFGNILFTNSAGSLGTSGTYLIPAGSTDAQKVTDESAYAVYLSPDRYTFFANMESGVLISFYAGADGTGDNLNDAYHRQDSPVTTGNSITCAAFGMIWAWTSAEAEGSGVYISGPGIDLGQVFDQPAILPTWNHQDNTLYFFSGSQLYLAYRFQYQAEVIGDIGANPQGTAMLAD